MNIMLNFWPGICKNKKFMNFFVKTIIFLFFRVLEFFYALYINFRQNNQ